MDIGNLRDLINFSLFFTPQKPTINVPLFSLRLPRVCILRQGLQNRWRKHTRNGMCILDANPFLNSMQLESVFCLFSKPSMFIASDMLSTPRVTI